MSESAEAAAVPAARARRGFPRTVVLLSLASFANDVASEVLLKGALPLYVVAVLGAPPIVVGLVDGAAESAATLLQIVTGWWADRARRRKPFVLAGYALSNLVKPLLYFAAGWGQVLLVRVLDRVGKGLRVPPRDALIADAAAPSERGRAFGLHHALDPAGAMVSLVAGALIVALSQDPAAPLAAGTFRNLVLFIVVPGLSTLVLAGLVREPARRILPAPTPQSPAAGSSLGRPFWTFIAITVLFSLGNSTDSFLILRAADLGMSLPQLFLLLAAFNLMSVLFSLPAGALSDRFGRRRFLAAGWILYAAVYAGFGFARDAGPLVPLLLLYGVYYGLTEGVGKALVADLVPPERRATAYGILATVQGLCVLPAGLLAGWLWTAASPRAPFLTGAGLSLAAAAGLALLPGASGPRGTCSRKPTCSTPGA
ncbi:MAG TPA: MFS transporter [Planctomycetota bacterium]|nr:MFS transporter [Planctomycetota bacterium]